MILQWPRNLAAWIENRLRADPYGNISLTARLLSACTRSAWKSYAFAAALDALAAGATALMTYLLSHAVNQIYTYRNFAAVAAMCLVFLALMIIRGLAFYGQALTLARTVNEQTAHNQRRIFGKLLREGLNFYIDRHSSEFVAQIAFSAGAGPGVLSLLVSALAGDSLTLIGLFGVMAAQDPVISIAAITVMPITAFFLRSLISKIKSNAARQFEVKSKIFESMQESVQGLRTIKAFALEDLVERRVHEQTQASKAAADDLADLSNRSTPLMETVGGIAVALLILYAGYRVIYRGALPGEIVSLIAAFLLAYEPTKRLAKLNVALSSGLLGVQTFYRLVDTPPIEQESATMPSLALERGRIEFAKVHFGYRADTPVLQGMSFVAEPGRVTALVGPSGGGKSTVLSLILRFYRLDTGTITIDGQDIAGVSLASLRQSIGYVGQDIFMFRGTIRENIRLGQPDADDEAIIVAAKAAYAHEFISSLPNGYDTQVGEHGWQLSTGQRQRVSIARAFLKNAPLILLDEPTAALDSESEEYIQEAIARLSDRRTTMVIAHRLRTIMHADRILFVEGGRIIESGNHRELLQADGRYAAFHRLQFEEKLPRPILVGARQARGG